MKSNLRSFCIKLGIAAALLGVVCANPGDACALTVQDIIVMHAQGVPENIVISVIKNAQDIAPLDKSDYEKLKQEGISQEIAAEIAMRVKALEKDSGTENAAPAENGAAAAAYIPQDAGAAAADIPQDAGAAERNAAIAPDDQNGATSAPIRPDSADAPRIVQGTVLSPIETSNAVAVFDSFFKALETAYLAESEIMRRYAEMRSETDALEDAMSSLPAVARYRKEIREGAPIRALDSCLSMLNEISPNPDTAIGAALRQCIGEALGAIGAFGMAAAYLDAALQSSATVEDYADTFRTFLDYARRTDYSSTAPLRIAAHENDIEKASDLADTYRYFVAYSLVYGPNPNIDAACRTLEAISPGTIEYARSRLLMAAIDVRPPAFRFKTAAEHIGLALSALEPLSGDTVYQLKNTAWLTLARIAAENHAYDAAAVFYGNVGIRSHRLSAAILEQAWTEIFAKRYDRALALTHALRAPIFAKAWLPDMLLIEANAYLGLCRYDDAQRAVDALRSTYIADGETLSRLMAETPARDCYGQILRHAQSPESSALPARIYARVLSDLPFKRVHQSLRTLNREREILSRYASQNFAFRADLEKTYDDAIAYRQTAMSQILRNVYNSALEEIHALDVSAAQVAIEIKLSQRKREAACLKIAAAGGACAQPQRMAAAKPEKAPDEAYWSFDREFWRDELRSYAVSVPSLCLVGE